MLLSSVWKEVVLKRYSCSVQFREAGRTKEMKEIGTAMMLHAKKIFPHVSLVTRAMGLSALI